MRFYELFEAPINDITLYPMDDGSSFSKSDAKLLRSPRAKERMIRAFSKTPFVFDIHFVESELVDADLASDNADVDKHARQELAGIHPNYEFHDLYFAGKPGVITVVMLSNLSPTSDKMPMTAWTLAHKIGHSFQDHIYNNVWPDDRVTKLAKQINNAISRVGSKKRSTNFDPSPATPQFLTMRSARAGALENPFEVFPEIIAQYLITGKVTLTDRPELADKINQSIAVLLRHIVGKVLVEV